MYLKKLNEDLEAGIEALGGDKGIDLEKEMEDFLGGLDHAPDDTEMHAFAEKIGANVHELEAAAYKMLWNRMHSDQN